MDIGSTILSAPVIYSLEITPFCNNRCIGCSNVFMRNLAPLSLSGWQCVLERIAPHVQEIKLTGGEPTLHPEFEEIVHIIADRDISFTLFTNGRWANPEQLVALLRSVSQCGGLLISLHGANETSHEAFTRYPGSFTETSANIRLASQSGLRVHISTVITRWNWQQIEDIVAFGQELGARRVVFNRYIGPENPQIEPEGDQLLAAVVSINNLQREGKPVKFGNSIPQCFVKNSSRGCWAGTAYCTIDPWGNLRPCNHSPLIVGNVLEQPIEELWSSEKINRWRMLLPGQCRQCSQLEFCRGGCTAMIEIRHLERDPLATRPMKNNDNPREIILFEGSHPMISCLVRLDHSGYVLTRGSSLYTLPGSTSSFLKALDGKNTLKEILARFGQNAINLVGVLCEQGLVELRH